MVRKNLTNKDIYSIAVQLSTEHIAQLNLCLPVKVNFYLQKNVTTIMSIAEDLENHRNEILEKYGTKQEDGNYSFTDENLEIANKELIDLFDLEQEVPIYEIDLDAFEDVKLESNQVQAIAYMIKDEKE